MAKAEAKAGSSKPQTATPANAPSSAPADLTPEVQEYLTLEDLARAVLSRRLRPRAADVRRLAEGVLERAAAATKLGAKKGKKNKKIAAPAAKAGKMGGGKKRKMAKIPAKKG